MQPLTMSTVVPCPVPSTQSIPEPTRLHAAAVRRARQTIGYQGDDPCEALLSALDYIEAIDNGGLGTRLAIAEARRDRALAELQGARAGASLALHQREQKIRALQQTAAELRSRVDRLETLMGGGAS